MKAMVLAAGLGTRLRPLTDDRPKALVEVAGRPLLEIVLTRLRAAGVSEAIINTHHFAAMIVDYLTANQNFGMRIEISHEETLLDTGGGLKHAAWFFLEDAGRRDEPFLIHNVDVISTIDLVRMVQFHLANRALATLAVQHRESSRYLLFDPQLRLCGRRLGQAGAEEVIRSSGKLEARAFCGIHVVSSRIFDGMTEQGAFSIISAYLRLATQQEKILAFENDAAYWRDLGRPESIRQAAAELALWSSQRA
jgi:NDP-sugar pyrophosphorylase family protein